VRHVYENPANTHAIDLCCYLKCRPQNFTTLFIISSTCFLSLNKCGSLGYATNSHGTPYRRHPRWNATAWLIGTRRSFSPWSISIGVFTFFMLHSGLPCLALVSEASVSHGVLPASSPSNHGASEDIVIISQSVTPAPQMAALKWKSCLVTAR